MNLPKKISYTLKSDFDLNTTIHQLKELFECESIKYKMDKNSIESTSIPFPIISCDMRAISRLNWVGINPFVYISSISIKADILDQYSSLLKIEINQKRAVMVYWFVAACFLAVAVALPTLFVAIIFLAISLSISGYLIFGLCVKRLIKKELNYAIKA